MQKPTLCIYETTHVQQHARVYKHPWASTTTCFRKPSLKLPTFQEVKNKRLVNALKICLLPHPVMSRRHPSVSLRVQRYKKNMDWANFGTTIVQENGFCRGNMKKLAVRCCEFWCVLRNYLRKGVPLTIKSYYIYYLMMYIKYLLLLF